MSIEEIQLSIPGLLIFFFLFIYFFLVILISSMFIQEIFSFINKCEDVSMTPTIQNGDIVLISPLPVDYNRLKK